ncbi:D-glycerate dehydrogenase [candidate division KSB3 bacterium]|uniref:D-glycerate dehydrogenase n=1 Tax=candidate division KSB3 bacterium TaxID=2044937 RepID=A0A2G6K933_9BACT|nr:MAG: D-glycerate dehydrogenase [candidate division KSB3 bacterium]
MSKPNVYVTRMIPQEGIGLLQATCDVEINPHDRPLTREELLEQVKGRDGILCLLTDKIDAEVYEAAQGVKGFANYAVGYDNINVPEATKRGLPISNTPGVLTDATAEMAWALLFGIGRRMIESDTFMRSGQWEGWGPMQFIGGDVTGQTLGIVGAGRIGTAMAMKSRGFNMKVLYADAFQNETLEQELGAQKVDLDTLLAESDFVSVHVPLLPETKHLFGKTEFQKMKKTAYLINTARGPIVNEVELVEALKNEEIAGAGLDVYEFEPKMVEGLKELSNVVVTPHTASATVSSRGSMARLAATNLLAMLEGKEAPNCVNPEVYGK